MFVIHVNLYNIQFRSLRKQVNGRDLDDQIFMFSANLSQKAPAPSSNICPSREMIDSEFCARFHIRSSVSQLRFKLT